MSGGIITSVVPFSGGVFGYGSGYTAAPTSGKPLHRRRTGLGPRYSSTIGKYIQSIPVTNGGSGFTSPPTFTISDSGSGRERSRRQS